MNPYDPADYYSIVNIDHGSGAAVTVDLDKALAHDRNLAERGEAPSWSNFCANVERALDQVWERREQYEKLEAERRARFPNMYAPAPTGNIYYT